MKKIELVGDILAHAAQHDYGTLSDKHACVSYRELYRDVIKFAMYLHTKYENEQMIIFGENSIRWIQIFFAIVESGNVAVPLDVRLQEKESAALIKKVNAKVIFYDREQKDKVKKILQKNEQIRQCICFQDWEENMHAVLQIKEKSNKDRQNSNQVCSMFFTSGTTGNAKAVMLTHKNICSNVLAICEGDIYQVQDIRLLSVLPPSHVYGLVCEIMCGIYKNVYIHINDAIPHFLENLKIVRPDIIMVVPMMIEYLVVCLKKLQKKYPEKSAKEIGKMLTGGQLKNVICGGAHLIPTYQKILQDYGIYVRTGYGMTECAPQIATHSIEGGNKESVGKILNNVQVKIVDQEIWVRGDNVMAGYYEQPEETAKVLQNGWLRTGDLGYMDEERNLYLTGRKKNLIILSNGENVSPETIENRLLAFSKIIEEVIVREENNQIVAHIYPRKKMEVEEEIENNIQKIIDLVNTTMPSYSKICRFVIRTEKFERTSTQKIKR